MVFHNYKGVIEELGKNKKHLGWNYTDFLTKHFPSWDKFSTEVLTDNKNVEYYDSLGTKQFTIRFKTPARDVVELVDVFANAQAFNMSRNDENYPFLRMKLDKRQNVFYLRFYTENKWERLKDVYITDNLVSFLTVHYVKDNVISRYEFNYLGTNASFETKGDLVEFLNQPLSSGVDLVNHTIKAVTKAVDSGALYFKVPHSILEVIDNDIDSENTFKVITSSAVLQIVLINPNEFAYGEHKVHVQINGQSYTLFNDEQSFNADWQNTQTIEQKTISYFVNENSEHVLIVKRMPKQILTSGKPVYISKCEMIDTNLVLFGLLIEDEHFEIFSGSQRQLEYTVVSEGAISLSTEDVSDGVYIKYYLDSEMYYLKRISFKNVFEPLMVNIKLDDVLVANDTFEVVLSNDIVQEAFELELETKSSENGMTTTHYAIGQSKDGETTKFTFNSKEFDVEDLPVQFVGNIVFKSNILPIEKMPLNANNVSLSTNTFIIDSDPRNSMVLHIMTNSSPVIFEVSCHKNKLVNYYIDKMALNDMSQDIVYDDELMATLKINSGTWYLDFGNHNVSKFALVDRMTSELTALTFKHVETGQYVLNVSSVLPDFENKVYRFDIIAFEDKNWQFVKVSNANNIPEWEKYNSEVTLIRDSGRQIIFYIQKNGMLSAVYKKFTHLNSHERKLIFVGQLDDVLNVNNNLEFDIKLRTVYPTHLDTIDSVTLTYRGSDYEFEMNSDQLDVTRLGANKFEIKATFDKANIEKNIFNDSYMLIVHGTKNGETVLYHINEVTEHFFDRLNGHTRDVYQITDKKKFLIQTALDNTLWIHYRDMTDLDSKAVRQRESEALQKYAPNQMNGNILMFEKEAQMAQDNAFALFKYLQTTDIAKKVFYVIDPKSPQRKYLEPWNNQVIELYSENYFKHLIEDQMIVTSESLAHVYQFNYASGTILNIIRKKTNYFLQHGVIGIRKLGDVFKYRTSGFTYFNTSTDHEREIVLQRFKYPVENVVTYGLPRWNFLNNRTKNEKLELVYFPTWREYLAYLSDDEFINSEYFKTIRSFITSDTLEKYLNEYNIHLRVFLHPKMRKFTSQFSGIDGVDVIDSSTVSLSVLIKEADGVISDYSSMVWDFAYQRKPIILFQFDQTAYETFWGGFFDKTIWKFGPIVTNQADLLNEIKKFGERDAIIEETYRQSMDDELGNLQNINENHYKFITNTLRNQPLLKTDDTDYSALRDVYLNSRYEMSLKIPDTSVRVKVKILIHKLANRFERIKEKLNKLRK